MLAIVVLNAVTYKEAIDISVLGYALEGICIYYCVFSYTPQRLLPKTVFSVVEDMSVALIVLDLDAKLIYSNKLAKMLMEEEISFKTKKEQTLEEWSVRTI